MTLQNSECTYMRNVRVAALLAITALGVICCAVAQDAAKLESDGEIQKQILAVDT